MVHTISNRVLAMCVAGLAGCGGGTVSGPGASAGGTPVAAAAGPSTLRLQGCTADRQFLPASAVAVHARLADGRLVGTTYSSADGTFVLTVPARTSLVLDTAVDGPGQVTLITGDTPLSVGACLQY